MIEFGLIEPVFVVYILCWCVQWIIQILKHAHAPDHLVRRNFSFLSQLV